MANHLSTRRQQSLAFAVSICALLIAAHTVLANKLPERVPTGPAIDYAVSIPNPESETFSVSAAIYNITKDTLVFHFPIWAPGAYDIVDFGAYVSGLTASDENGKPLTIIRGDTNTFRILRTGKKVNLHYTVHDIEYVSNSAWFGLSDVEPDYGFANTSALFGYPADYKYIPYTVTYLPPDGWDMTVGLDPMKGEKNLYTARDYDELVDAPVQMGNFQRYEFTMNGKEHIITISKTKLTDVGAKKVVQTTKDVVKVMSEFFGEMPYDRYIFQHYLVNPQTEEVQSNFGALEHRNSSTYLMPYTPASGSAADILMPVIAHEYWHLWSPKRFHVSELGPFDYQRAPRTNSLWFAEGLTEYYARVLLIRNGLTDEENFISEMERDVLQNYGTEQKQAITELSLKVTELPISKVIALYIKGPVVGMLLDAEIRSQTGNKKSLDDAMRYFNTKYSNSDKGFTDDDIIPEIERATGASLKNFYTNYISGTKALPFDELLPKMGMNITTTVEQLPSIGADITFSADGWLLSNVTPGGSADDMGLQDGDLITALSFQGRSQPLGGLSIPENQVDKLFEGLPKGLDIIYTHNGEEVTVPLVLKTVPVDVNHLHIDMEAKGLALEIRKGMLGL